MDEFNEFQRVVNLLLEALQPLLSKPVVIVRNDLGVMDDVSPYTGPLVNTGDTITEASTKILQVLNKMIDSNGSVYIVLSERSDPYVEPEVVKQKKPIPVYHPVEDRRYWDLTHEQQMIS